MESLRKLWTWWKGFAHKLGNAQSRLILLLFYFIVIPPFAMILKRVSDPLGLKKSSQTGWRPVEAAKSDSLEASQKQF